MRNPAIRRTLRLTVSLIGLQPVVWRELIVDHALTLADLHEAISLAVSWSPSEHHVFSDRLPDHLEQDRAQVDLAAVGSAPGHWLQAPSRPSTPRRWGDRWTMIDWRDPGVHDEASTTIGDALWDSALYYASDVAGRWWCRIEAHGDDVESVAQPRARLTSGSGHAPIPGGPTADELPRLHDILANPAHPDHARISEAFDAHVGPWADYRPGSVDLDLPRYDLARRFAPARAAARSVGRRAAAGRTALETLVDEVSEATRPGLRRHLLRHGLADDEPIDPDAAATATKAFSWLLATVDPDGTPLTADGSLEGGVSRAGAEYLGWSADRVDALAVTAKRLGLVRRLRGRLVGIKAALACRGSAEALWAYLALRLPDYSTPWRHDPRGTLLLLAVADGSIERPDAEERLAASLGAVERDPWRWADGTNHYAPPLEWWQEWGSTSLYAPALSGGSAVQSLEKLFETLTFLGLDRTDDGGWTVPASLRMLVRASLTATRRP